MARYGLLIDIKKCTGCYNCFLACRDEYFGNDYPGYSAAQPLNGQFWMQVKEVERGEFPRPKVDYIPTPCQHCAGAPCISAATDGAVYRRADGIVIIDPEKARGQKQIVNACPYRVIFWNEELQLAQKCTLCAHRLDEGEALPRCVESCPTGALVFGDLSDPGSDLSVQAKAASTEELHPEFAVKPAVRYRGIPQRFVAGEVVLADQQELCAAGVTLSLSGAGQVLDGQTDLFGDFEFEGLKVGGKYHLTISKEGYQPASCDFVALKDVYLGEIILQRR